MKSIIPHDWAVSGPGLNLPHIKLLKREEVRGVNLPPTCIPSKLSPYRHQKWVVMKSIILHDWAVSGPVPCATASMHKGSGMNIMKSTMLY